MRKCLFACVLVFLYAILQAQELQDSLGKYSYLVQIDKRCKKTQATGFFARYQQRLFFISAAHCLTGWDPVEFRPIENFPDTIFIRLSNDTSNVSFLPLPVAGIKKKAKPFHQLEAPDVVVVEIKNGKKYKVNSVEAFFTEEVPCEFASKVLVSGYPYENESDDYLKVRQQPLTMGTSLDNTYCIYPYRPDVKLYDRLHYFTSFKEADISASGLSGAPAYLLTKNETIVFGGIFIGGVNTRSGRGMIVRPEYVINKIMARIMNE
ncbi:MAG: hypothetical protein EOO10_17360 [Chitinophagaceae bacterium]|nr:MAG: hypothetical protein EOO10_17360 [Chitinophagaceae bacterium]